MNYIGSKQAAVDAKSSTAASAQDGSIYVIDVIPHSFDEAFDTVDECPAELVNSFAILGGAAQRETAASFRRP